MPVRELARARIGAPIIRPREIRPLRCLQPQRVDRRLRHERRRHQAGDVEFARLFEAVGEIIAGIGKADHLRAGSLRLQQGGGEIGGAGERIGHLAEHLRPRLRHRAGGIGHHGFAEFIVGQNKEPALAALRDDGFHQRGREGKGVGGELNMVRPAPAAGELGTGGRGDQPDLVFVFKHLARRQRQRREREIRHGIDAVIVEPGIENGQAVIRLQPEIRDHRLDGNAGMQEGEILHRQLHCGQHALAGNGGIGAVEIGEAAELQTWCGERLADPWQREPSGSSGQHGPASEYCHGAFLFFWFLVALA